MKDYYKTDKCLMCGMELLPEVLEYNQKYKSKTKLIIRRESFCDNKCRGYFYKRLWADEMGVKLDE
jgi:hypothetical protein